MILISKQKRRKGVVIVLAALCMSVLIGLAALTIDIGLKHDRLRHLRGTVDACAMAGAADLFKNWRSTHGTDPFNSARNSVLAIAQTNGYTNNQNGVIID